MDAKLINTLELNGDVSIPEKYIGPRGYSAYEVAVKEGFEGTVEEWLESLHGEVDFADLTDTQKESLRGPAGKDGRDGEDAIAAINPRGTFTDGETYNKNDYVTAEDGNTYTCMVDGTTTSPIDTPLVWQVIALKGATGEKGADGLDGLPGANGLSNYQIAQRNGFEGTEEEWLETLKSDVPGPQGEQGIQGEPFTYEDFTEEQLEALRGPQGLSAYEVAVENGFEGTEEEWLQSLVMKGIQIKIVEELPEIGEDKVLYFLPIDDGTHEEYMWIAGKWEMIGTTKVDLSDYYTKQEIDELIADGKIITFKDTTINNMSYLEDINLPCALHLVNSWLGGMFNDDIVYVRTAGDEMIRVFTMDNVMYELDIYPDGSLHVVLITNISDEIDAVKGELEAKITQSHNPTWVAWSEDANVLGDEDGPLSGHIIKIELDKFSQVPKLNERGLLVSRNRWNEYRLCYCHVGWFEEERVVLYADYVVRVDRHDLYTKDEVDTLLEDKLITIKDTEVTNISQLPMDKLPCCLHMINSTFHYEFNDDIIYVASASGLMALWTMDGQIAYFTYNDDGEIIVAQKTGFVDGTTLVEQFYNKDEVDNKIANIELTPGPKGDDGAAATIGLEVNTDDEYILKIENPGETFETPNLKGPAGKDGKDGEPGPQGEKGTTWFTGTEDPNTSPDPDATPREGDIFLNTTNGDVYKYNGTTWVLSGNFKGPKGDNGADSTVPGPAGADGQDYVLTDEDKAEIAALVDVSAGVSAATNVSFDDSVAGLGATTVQEAIEALADDDIGSEQVQDMIDENLSSVFGKRMNFVLDVLTTPNYSVTGYQLSMSGNPEYHASTYEEIIEIGQIYNVCVVNSSSINKYLSSGVGSFPGLKVFKYNTTKKVFENTGNTSVLPEFGDVIFKINEKLALYLSGGSKVSYNDWSNVTKQLFREEVLDKLVYDNTESGLTATTIHGAIDELAARPAGLDEDTVDQKIADAIAAITDFTEVSF